MSISTPELMRKLLEQLKFIDYLTTEIPIKKEDFLEAFRKNVDEGNTGTLFSGFEAFSASKNQYKGTVGNDNFKIRRRKRLFDFNPSGAIIKGTFKQKDDNMLVIESEINSFHGVIIPFLIFILLFYIAAITLAFTLPDDDGIIRWLMLPIILIHATFVLGIPYLMARRSTSRLKYELERDFYYMTKK